MPRAPAGRDGVNSRSCSINQKGHPVVDSQFATHTELFDLSGKHGLVTGGTRGIGLMIARGLLQAGARVVISSRSAEACARAQEQLSEFGDVWTVPADLSRHEECERLADLVSADSGSLDILVNNAGAMWDEPLATFPDAAWDTVIDLNLKAPFWLVQALAHHSGSPRPRDPSLAVPVAGMWNPRVLVGSRRHSASYTAAMSR